MTLSARLPQQLRTEPSSWLGSFAATAAAERGGKGKGERRPGSIDRLLQAQPCLGGERRLRGLPCKAVWAMSLELPRRSQYVAGVGSPGGSTSRDSGGAFLCLVQKVFFCLWEKLLCFSRSPILRMFFLCHVNWRYSRVGSMNRIASRGNGVDQGQLDGGGCGCVRVIFGSSRVWSRFSPCPLFSPVLPRISLHRKLSAGPS